MPSAQVDGWLKKSLPEKDCGYVNSTYSKEYAAKKTKIVSWLNNEGVLLAVREYMFRVGQGISALGLAIVITTYVEVVEREKHFVESWNIITER